MEAIWTKAFFESARAMAHAHKGAITGADAKHTVLMSWLEAHEASPLYELEDFLFRLREMLMKLCART